MLHQPVPADTQLDAFHAVMQKAMHRTLALGDLITAAEALKVQGNKHRVVELYKTWLAYNADQPFTHAVLFNYAISLADAGDRPGGVNALRETIRINPNFSPAYINLGTALEALGQKDRAVQTWRLLIDRFENVGHESVKFKTMALNQTARVFEGAHNDEQAELSLQQSLSINPKQPEAIQHWVSLRQRQCKWPAIVAWDEMTPNMLLDGISPLTNACYTDDPMFQMAHGYKYQRDQIGRPKSFKDVTGSYGHLEAQPQRLKIGYVSSDLRDHAVGFSMIEVVALHDRKAFEIHAYYCGIPGVYSTQTRIRAGVDHWTDINGMEDAAVADKIRADGIHILIDLNGYTKDARTKVFSLRPAPINVNWFGYPNSMGSPYHHYIVADDEIIPESQEKFYSERVVRLPCYQPNDRKRIVAQPGPTRAQENLPEDKFVYCCLNGMQKLNAETFQSWLTILHHVPNSVLWLLAGTTETNQRLSDMAKAAGIEPTRLIFADKRANPEHVARYALGDLFLDTFPYGAHTTAADALWVGTPIVTLPGKSFASKVCASLLKAAGMPDLICSSRESYTREAIVIGQNPDRAKALRARLLANRDTCTLFDSPKLVRHLEDLYRGMWQDFVSGNLPVPDLSNLEIYHDIGLELDQEALRMASEEELLALYEKHLRERHNFATIKPDVRLWPAPQPQG